jgi:hypothetical protein
VKRVTNGRRRVGIWAVRDDSMSVREMIVRAALELGGSGGLTRWAAKNQTAFWKHVFPLHARCPDDKGKTTPIILRTTETESKF